MSVLLMWAIVFAVDGAGKKTESGIEVEKLL
jgi:hypothetical protein